MHPRGSWKHYAYVICDEIGTLIRTEDRPVQVVDAHGFEWGNVKP